MKLSRRRAVLSCGVAAAVVGLAAVGLPYANAQLSPAESTQDSIAVTVDAAADTSVSRVPQDGDGRSRTTLVTCARTCERNPNGERVALVEFVVNGLPANATNIKAEFQIYSWRDFPATIEAYPADGGARSPGSWETLPELGPLLDSNAQVSTGYNMFDVSVAVTGNGTYTFALRQPSYQERVYWASKENTRTSIRPKLVVSYDTGSVTPSPSVSSSASLPPSPTASTTPSPTASPTSPAPTCGQLSSKLVPSCGALLGMYAPSNANMGWDENKPILDRENMVGRPFDIIHRYRDFSNTGGNGVFPSSYDKQLIADGRIMFYALESRMYQAGTNITWPQVYNGEYDATIDQIAKRIKDAGVPMFVDFDHEMDGRTEDGTEADFVKAHRHVVNRFRDMGTTNAIFLWTPMGWSGNYSKYKAFYPGDEYVDWVAWDLYNFYHCNGNKTWKTPEAAIGSFYQWLDDNKIGVGKPRLLAEFGTSFDPANPKAKADWYRAFPAALKKYPKIKAVVKFDSPGAFPTTSTCNMTMTQDQSSIDGFTELANDPYLNSRKM